MTEVKESPGSVQKALLQIIVDDKGSYSLGLMRLWEMCAFPATQKEIREAIDKLKSKLLIEWDRIYDRFVPTCEGKAVRFRFQQDWLDHVRKARNVATGEVQEGEQTESVPDLWTS